MFLRKMPRHPVIKGNKFSIKTEDGEFLPTKFSRCDISLLSCSHLVISSCPSNQTISRENKINQRNIQTGLQDSCLKNI